MAKLTDQLKRRTARSLVNSDMPEWWPAAQIAGAVFLVGALAVMAISHFGRTGTPATSSVPNQYGPGVTAAPASGLGTVPQVATSLPQPGTSSPNDSVPTEPGANKGMPTTIDATTVSVLRTDGTTKTVPLSAWLAARDSLAATYPSSTPTAVWLLSATGASNTFSVELSNPAGESINVQVTAMLQATGLWAAA